MAKTATIASRINAFIKKYPEPKQYAFRLKTGRDGYRMFDNKALIYMHSVSSVGWWIAAYRYDEKTDLFEAATIHIDCHKKNDNRRWTYFHRYFITRDRKLYDINGNEPTRFIAADSAGEKYAYDKKHYIMALTNLTQAHDYVEQFTAFAKEDYRTSGNPYCTYESPYYLRNWITYKEKSANATKKSKQDVDSCLSIELNAVDASTLKVDGTAWYNNSIGIAEIHDDVVVFRQFTNYTDGIKETKRVYFFNPKKVFYLKEEQGNWTKSGFFTENLFNGKIQNPEVFNDTKYKFVNDFVPNKSKLYRYVIAIREPLFEQMYKMGVQNEIKSAFKDYYTPLSNLDYVFGVSEEKKKDRTYHRYELTPKQLVYIDNNRGRMSAANLKLFKKSYNARHMDIDKFKSMYKYVANLSDIYPSWERRRENKIVLDDEEKVVFERLCKIAEKENNDTIFAVYRDAKRYYNNNIIDTNPAQIKKAEELRRLHDAGVEIEIQQRVERDAKRNAELDVKRKEVDKKRKGWNYEEEKYLIRLPNQISEITIEGQKLHHCVGGYAQSHAIGDTTILFLRDKANPDKPFYTIEVRNNYVVQIHGFGNRWLGNDADAIPTVMRWLRKTGITCDNHILTCKAIGYGSGNAGHVALPEID